MTRNRRDTLKSAIEAIICLGVAVLVLQLGGCAGVRVSDRAGPALQVALGATDAAAEHFLRWDRERQLGIADDPALGTRDEVRKALESHRAGIAAVDHAFTIAYTAIADAATLLPLVDAGERQAAEFLAALKQAAAALGTAAKLAGGGR